MPRPLKKLNNGGVNTHVFGDGLPLFDDKTLGALPIDPCDDSGKPHSSVRSIFRAVDKNTGGHVRCLSVHPERIREVLAQLPEYLSLPLNEQEKRFDRLRHDAQIEVSEPVAQPKKRKPRRHQREEMPSDALSPTRISSDAGSIENTPVYVDKEQQNFEMLRDKSTVFKFFKEENLSPDYLLYVKQIQSETKIQKMLNKVTGEQIQGAQGYRRLTNSEVTKLKLPLDGGGTVVSIPEDWANKLVNEYQVPAHEIKLQNVPTKSVRLR